LIVILFASCKPKPEFYIKGKPFYTRTHCVESHNETKYGYHYGYNFFKGNYSYHFGMYNENICDKEVSDTIEIKE
jgi:hypothetical protein